MAGSLSEPRLVKGDDEEGSIQFVSVADVKGSLAGMHLVPCAGVFLGDGLEIHAQKGMASVASPWVPSKREAARSDERGAET